MNFWNILNFTRSLPFPVSLPCLRMELNRCSILPTHFYKEFTLGSEIGMFVVYFYDRAFFVPRGHPLPYYPRVGGHGTKRDYPWSSQEAYIPQNYGGQSGSLQQPAGYYTEPSPRYHARDYDYEPPLFSPPEPQPWRQPRPPHPY